MKFVKNGPDIPDRLIEAHEDGQVVFFCGAGISYPARLPGFKGLVERIYATLGAVPSKVQQRAIRAKRYDTAIGLLEQDVVGGREAVRRALAAALVPDLTAPKALATHEALLELGKLQDGRYRLITTNFDRLFQEVVSKQSLKVPTFEAPLLPVPKHHTWDGLVYLHGLLPPSLSVHGLNRLVVSSGDFGMGYLTERWASRFVSELFRNFTVCFVGYSLDDPVLRYMMDALAADQLLGGTPPEMYAFGSYSKGKAEDTGTDWRAKHVSPILYPEFKHHTRLHQTLHRWAETYRDGVLGKERIVAEHASTIPLASTQEDNFIGRMLWALSDKGGLPAQRFAEMDPAPPLEWLEPLTEARFGHEDLIRFRVTPDPNPDPKLKFSLLRRPTRYGLAPSMALVHGERSDRRWDALMSHMARWLARHLDQPKLAVWIASQGSRVDDGLRWQIRSSLKDQPPSPAMCSLWNLILADRLHPGSDWIDQDLGQWMEELKQKGLTTSLRFRFREILTPYIRLSERMSWHGMVHESGVMPKIKDLVNVEVILATDQVHYSLRRATSTPHWVEALPALYPEALALLRDTLDLMREVGSLDDTQDFSFFLRPSIGMHTQNTDHHDWTALLDIVRDGWLALAESSPEVARSEAERWWQVPYPLFKRMALFAATHLDVIPPEQGIRWLLSNQAWWLWALGARRETLQLVQALAPKLSPIIQEALEQAVLQGPPREMYKPGTTEERWLKIMDDGVWLILAKAQKAGLSLGSQAAERFQAITDRHLDWQLAEDDSDEFPYWSSGVTSWGGDREVVPKRRQELIDLMLRTKIDEPESEEDWRARCRVKFSTTACALLAVSKQGVWPLGPWREALHAWSQEPYHRRSWRYMAPVLDHAPDAVLHGLRHPLAWWLQSVTEAIDVHVDGFFGLARRILLLERTSALEEEGEVVDQAINHPVGLITDALLRWWYQQAPRDDEGLSEALRQMFTDLCDPEILNYRHARVVLATHAISLLRVDPDWTAQHLIPLFDWQRSAPEARTVWKGFLWSPRLFRPLMECLKTSFLESADHFEELGHPQSEQYATLLTYTALDPADTFTRAELATATHSLPASGLAQAAQALVRAQEGITEKRADHWRHRILPYWKSTWPKARAANTPEVARRLGHLCIVTDEAFPEAVHELTHWFRPADHPHTLIHDLNKSGLCGRFPEAALILMNAIIPEQLAWPPTDLKSCLDEVVGAQPGLGTDSRYRRLSELLRIHGIN